MGSNPTSSAFVYGSVAEWTNAPHLKCGKPAMASEVRILPLPQRTKFQRNFYVAETFNFQRKLLRFAKYVLLRLYPSE